MTANNKSSASSLCAKANKALRVADVAAVKVKFTESCYPAGTVSGSVKNLEASRKAIESAGFLLHPIVTYSFGSVYIIEPAVAA